MAPKCPLLSLSSATQPQPSSRRWEELPKLGPTACSGVSERSVGHRTTCHLQHGPLRTDQPTEPYLSAIHPEEPRGTSTCAPAGCPAGSLWHWEGVFSPGEAMRRFLGQRERRPRARAENSSRWECECVCCCAGGGGVAVASTPHGVRVLEPWKDLKVLCVEVEKKIKLT